MKQCWCDRRETGAIETYQADGWRGAARDRVKPNAALALAERQVLFCCLLQQPYNLLVASTLYRSPFLSVVVVVNLSVVRSTSFRVFPIVRVFSIVIERNTSGPM
jgi:hypothetical protein